ncbi:MAG: Uma2 family endonuclease [Candidatus Xenobia bacterium]
MTIRQQPTLQEFLQWPERKPYLEYIHGTVRKKSMPNAEHSFLQSQFATRLTNWRGPEHGFVLTEQRCVLEAQGETHTVLPGVAWFTREQLAALPRGPVRVPPTLAIEIVSPDDAYSDVQDKVVIYLHAGVPLVWVVDPIARKVSTYRPGREPQVYAAAATLEDLLLLGLSIPLAEIFAFLPESPQPRLD